jgi:Xaa-Pro aminopeptidase
LRGLQSSGGPPSSKSDQFDALEESPDSGPLGKQRIELFIAVVGRDRGVALEDGMVLCVETPYYQIGWGGMMVEDKIVIRPAGNECLTHLPRELRRL